MPVPLGEESRVSIPSSVLGEIAELTRDQSRHVQTELKKMTTAEYSPTEFVYKQYGDLKVFRCGDEVRLFGVILEQLAVFDGFDHLVIVLEVSEHDYDQAGVTRGQAQELQETFASIDTRTEFREELTGAVFGSDQIDAIFESEKAESARSWIDQL